MRLRHLFLISMTLLIVFTVFQAWQPIQAAGIVGTGTPASCNEAALDAALSGGGSVTFNCGTNAVVIAVSKEKAISQATTMDGNGLVTLSGQNITRIFHVAASGILELHKLKLTYGAANDTSDTARDGIGGAILNDGGTVNLIDTMIASGRADHSGGAIYNNGGTISLVRATLSGNTVGDIGGAILNAKGTLNLANSTLSGNFAGKDGGGLYNFGGNVLITNSTIYDNSAGLNGSGILNNQEGKVAVKNSIIANVASGGAPNSGNCNGQIVDGNKNLQFPDNTCGKTIPVADPQLGTLSDNGGFVLTHALKDSSPAVNKADNAVCKSDPINSLDARNNARPVGASCDIGAYEFDPKKPGKGFGGTTADCNCNQAPPPAQATGTTVACLPQGSRCSPNAGGCCGGLSCKNISQIAVIYVCAP